MKGRIIKGIGGLYTVVDESFNTYECKARGKFRKNQLIPLVGDFVEFENDTQGKYVIEKIYEKRNSLVRPAVANIDRLFIVVSTFDPAPNLFVIDKTIAIAEYKDIEPIIVITKTDIRDNKEIFEIYKKSNIKTLFTNIVTGDGIEEFKNLLNGKVCAVTGNSGVGKSTLLNKISPELSLSTSQTSKKLGRGRHTTRHVELFYVNGGYIADTPGFSSLDVEKYDVIFKNDLQFCFSEMKEYIGNCKFTGCSHTSEKGCAIIDAVKEGKIQKSRFESYVNLYNEVKDLKEWEVSRVKK